MTFSQKDITNILNNKKNPHLAFYMDLHFWKNGKNMQSFSSEVLADEA